MIAAKKSTDSEADSKAEYDDEITIERRVKLPPEVSAYASHLTTKLTKIDSRLLAIARGELEPEDPFGGLIPIYDNEHAEIYDAEEEAQVVDDAWLMIDPPDEAEPEPGEGMFGKTVPRMRLHTHQLLALPIDERTAFFASQIDGLRTVEELIAACEYDELEGLEIVDELLRLGAIDLF